MTFESFLGEITKAFPSIRCFVFFSILYTSGPILRFLQISCPCRRASFLSRRCFFSRKQCHTTNWGTALPSSRCLGMVNLRSTGAAGSGRHHCRIRWYPIKYSCPRNTYSFGIFRNSLQMYWRVSVTCAFMEVKNLASSLCRPVNAFYYYTSLLFATMKTQFKAGSRSKDIIYPLHNPSYTFLLVLRHRRGMKTNLCPETNRHERICRCRSTAA
jgi:hypothetical protein